MLNLDELKDFMQKLDKFEQYKFFLEKIQGGRRLEGVQGCGREGVKEVKG